MSLRRTVRAVTHDALVSSRHHDLALYAAGLTFYGGIALLPATLVALRLAGVLVGQAHVARRGESVAAALPDTLGAPAVVDRLVEAGAHLPVLTLLLAVVPSTLYGEGLRRAFVRLAGSDESYVGWRGRLGVLPLLLVTPLMALAVLEAAPLLAHLVDDGPGGTALAVYLALVLDWLLLSVPLTFVYRVVSPAPVTWRGAALGALVTASFISGFLQGFVLFLALPLDLGLPFGGAVPVGAAVAVALWLWVLHLLVLVGHQLVMAVERRRAARAISARPREGPSAVGRPGRRSTRRAS
jgi:membrane protein